MSGKQQQNRQRSKRKKSSKKKGVDPIAFWGSVDSLPEVEGFPTETPDPVAVINSLGQPPLPGHGQASPHYFKLVYGRATQLASALAMAGGIDDLTPELVEEDSDDELSQEAGEEE